MERAEEDKNDIAMVEKDETVQSVFAGAERDIDKYMALRRLQTRDSEAYYRLLIQNTEEVLPYIYTGIAPVVYRCRPCCRHV